jgi:ABC-type dipeptide/oligopeptide/nickel transport system ATPase subunit
VAISGVLKSTIARVIQQQEKLQDGHYAMDNRELPINGSVKVRIQLLKGPSIMVLS